MGRKAKERRGMGRTFRFVTDTRISTEIQIIIIQTPLKRGGKVSVAVGGGQAGAAAVPFLRCVGAIHGSIKPPRRHLRPVSRANGKNSPNGHTRHHMRHATVAHLKGGGRRQVEDGVLPLRLGAGRVGRKALGVGHMLERHLNPVD